MHTQGDRIHAPIRQDQIWAFAAVPIWRARVTARVEAMVADLEQGGVGRAEVRRTLKKV